MKVYRKHSALIVESELLIMCIGWLMVGSHGMTEAKAAAFWPFLFIRKPEYATPMFINHERIHFRQQLETFFIGLWLWHIGEDFYSRVILRLKAPDYHYYRAVEQEAYQHQHDLTYLKERRPYAFLKYVRNKRKISPITSRPPEVLVGEKWNQ